MDATSIRLPDSILPADGRFGCGPSKVRPEQIDAIVAGATSIMGTSHRKPPVKDLVGSVRSGLAELFGLPDGWEIVLGNGGTTVFWDAATFGLVEERSQHLVFGEFSSKFADACAAAPHLGDADGDRERRRQSSRAGRRSRCRPVRAHPQRDVDGRGDAAPPTRRHRRGALVAVDATSGAGGLRWDPAEVDVYYFAPQKCFASDGGLWIAACSPAAVERIERIADIDRWRPASIDLGIALTNSRAEPDLQHSCRRHAPDARRAARVDERRTAGSSGCAARSDASAATMYGWAESREWATPFVADPAQRSSVVATIDLDDSIDATAVCAVLRTNGVLDTDSYRKLGRNQLRVGMFPAIEPSDVEALTVCIDHVVDAMSE